jgi:catechol 2,3-dioxygenase-like lactoylglutathione lyase family enzyme
MLDHISFAVKDPAASSAFYATALAPLGYTKVYDNAEHGVTAFGRQWPQLWLTPGEPTLGMHIAVMAEDRAAVDAFHAAALAAGGRDNGAPGLRPNYGPGYYAAYVYDPDGTNLEAVVHEQT